MKKEIFISSVLLIVLGVFLYRVYVFLDPDFGFQLRTGQLILTNGLPTRDPFSYTMPSYPVVSHEWLLVSAVAYLYPILGYKFIGFLFLLVGIGAFVVSLGAKKLLSRDSLAVYLFILALSLISPFFGVRMQVFSWLMMAILGNILYCKKHVKYFFIPLILLLWVNIHGSFVSGLIVLGIFFATKWFRYKKVSVFELFVLISSFTATFINPYGTGQWREVWDTVGDSALRWRITEWNPAVFNFNLAFLLFIPLSVVLVVYNRKKFVLEELFVYFYLLIQAFLSQRHIALWIVIALPLTYRAAHFFIEEAKNKKEAKHRLDIAAKVVFGISCALVITQSYLVVKESHDLSESVFYPTKAIAYLKQFPEDGNVFSVYGWGGYLIWKYPEKRVFIDGRMPSWRNPDAPENELDDAMKVHSEILSSKIDYGAYFAKFNIDTTLLPNEKNKDPLPGWATNLIPQKVSLEDKLISDGWKQVYADEVAVIYRYNRVDE